MGFALLETTQLLVLHSTIFYAESSITDVILSERQRVEESIPLKGCEDPSTPLRSAQDDTYF